MARGGGAKAMGEKVTPNPKFAWGTPEEVAQRDKATLQPMEPSFSQIGPAAGPGGNFNELPTDRVGGSQPFKFSKNV
jgi:hypothetical protein